MTYFAGLDIGGTSARLKIEDNIGNVLGEFFGQGCTLNIEGYEESRSRYRSLILGTLDSLGIKPSEFDGICLAASGVDTDETELQCFNIFEEMGFSKNSITVCNDCEVMLRCCEDTDIVLVAGTGSIAYGRAKDKSYVRCGGWGHILSDEGSAFDIALKTFGLVAMHLDKRADCPILCNLLTKESGLTTPNLINLYVNEHIFERPYIAKYAQLAEQAAKMGDKEADKLLDVCAEALYSLTLDTAKKIGKNKHDKLNIWLWGSVIKENSDMAARLIKTAHKNEAEFNFSHPYLTALDAALLTAKKTNV